LDANGIGRCVARTHRVEVCASEGQGCAGVHDIELRPQHVGDRSVEEPLFCVRAALEREQLFCQHQRFAVEVGKDADEPPTYLLDLDRSC
jgi:hypothetical protein